MRKTTIVIALLLLVPAFVAGFAQAAQHGGSQGDGKGADGNKSTDNRTGDQDGSGSQTDRGPPESAAERRSMAREKARKAGLFAQFSYQDGTADGKFVSFNLTETSATVADYTLKHNGTATPVFDEVAPDDFTGQGPARAAGSQVMLNGEELRLQAHDNPTALLRFTSTGNGTTVTFSLADGASTGDVRNGSLVNVKAGDRSGTIILGGNGTLETGAGTVTAQLDDAGSVLFRASPLGGSPQEAKQARALGKAMADGRLGSSVRMAGVNGTPASDTTEFDVNATPREASEGRARLELDSEAAEGRIVNLAVDKGTLNLSGPDRAEVKLDGRTISIEQDIDNVVNATGDQARAHVLVTNSTVEITVYVPSFSLHSLITKDVDESLPDLPTPDSVPNPSGSSMSTAAQARQQLQQRASAFDQLPDEVQSQAADQARQARIFGSFELSGGQASGAFVQAGVDANAGQVSGFAVADAQGTAEVFDAIQPDPYTRAAGPQQAGAALALVGNQVTTVVHDTPTGALTVKAGSSSVTVTYQLADGVTMERVGERHVKLAIGSTHGHLVLAGGNGEFSLEGDQIRLALGANAQGTFLLHPSQATATATALHERLDALKAGAFGAAYSVVGASGQAVETVQSYSVDAKTKALETGQRVTATVSSQAPDPRVVSLEVPLETVGASAAGDIEVTLDGQTVPATSTAAEVLASRASSQAHASVTVTQGAAHVLVNVPAFSDHDVSIQSADDSTDDGTTDDGTTDDGTTDGGQDAPAPGVAVLAGVMALAAALVALRRER